MRINVNRKICLGVFLMQLCLCFSLFSQNSNYPSSLLKDYKYSMYQTNWFKEQYNGYEFLFPREPLFHENYRNINTLSYYWINDEKEGWGENAKYIYNYNQDDNLESYFAYRMFSYGWEDHWREYYSLNENGVRIGNEYQYWDWEMSTWLYTFIGKYVYYENGILSRYEQHLRQYPEFVLKNFIDFDYDENQNLVSKIIYKWNYDQQYIIADSKRSDIYDDDNKITESNYYNWDIDSSKWEQYGTDTYSYDDNNRLEEILVFSWSFSKNEWKSIYTHVLSYNENNQISKYSIYAGSGASSLQSNTLYNYNENGLLKEAVTSMMHGYPYEFKAFHKYEYQWSDAVNTSFFETEKIILYPNPVQDRVIISSNSSFTNSELKIINVSGQTVYQRILNTPDKKIDIQLSFLEPGLYFLILKTENQQYNRKLIVK